MTLSGTPSFSPSPGPAGTSISRAPNSNVVSLRGLNLPKKTGSVTFTVALTTQNATAAATSITAQAKQSNDFSDSGQNPDANAFDNPAPASILKIALQTCTTTISGRIYHNRNGDLAYTTGTGNFDTSDLPKTWTVNIFSKLPAGSTYTPVTPAPPITQDSSNGMYSATVSTGRDYKVCVVATAPDDGAAWGLQAPSGNTACTPGLSPTSGTTSAAYLVPASALPASGKDFIAVPATPTFGPGSENVGSRIRGDRRLERDRGPDPIQPRRAGSRAAT